jgi:hypothetical protein
MFGLSFLWCSARTHHEGARFRTNIDFIKTMEQNDHLLVQQTVHAIQKITYLSETDSFVSHDSHVFWNGDHSFAFQCHPEFGVSALRRNLTLSPSLRSNLSALLDRREIDELQSKAVREWPICSHDTLSL